MASAWPAPTGATWCDRFSMTIDRLCPGQRLVVEAARTFLGRTTTYPAITTGGCASNSSSGRAQRATYSRSSKSSSSMSSRACPLVSHSPVRTNTGSRLTCSALTNLSQPSSGSIRAGGATPLEWLSLTGQAALEVTAGAVFEDPADEPTSLRDALAWYPDDVWRYVVACDWRSILGSSLPPHQPAHHPATARRHLRPSSPRSSCRAGQHRAAHRQCRPVGARQSPARRCPWRPGAHGERVRPGCLVPATVPCSATFRDPQPNPPASASARWHGPADRARR